MISLLGLLSSLAFFHFALCGDPRRLRYALTWRDILSGASDFEYLAFKCCAYNASGFFYHSLAIQTYFL